MADVQRSGLLILGGLVLLKTVDFASRGTAEWWPAFLVVWVAAGIAVWMGYRWALPVVTVLTAVAFAAGMHNQHMWLLMWIPLTFLVEKEREWLWRWQLTILYAFAALAKLNPDYLSGQVMGRRFDLPTVALIGLAVAGLATEAFLAFGLWRWRWTLAVGVVFHLTVVATMATDPIHGVRLAVFAGLVLMMYPAFYHQDPTRTGRVVSSTTVDGFESPSRLKANTR